MISCRGMYTEFMRIWPGKGAELIHIVRPKVQSLGPVVEMVHLRGGERREGVYACPDIVLHVSCTVNSIALKLPKAIHILEPHDLSCRHVIDTQLSPAMALGSRWLAFAAKTIPIRPLSPPHHDRLPKFYQDLQANVQSHRLVANDEDDNAVPRTMTDMAQTVASGFYNLGQWGHSFTDTTRSSSTPAEGETVGTVTVVDVFSGVPLVEFVAFEHSAVSLLTFDPSGLLLLSAPREGQSLHIHQLFPAVGTTSHRLLYTIVRGVTHAHIVHATFATDNQLLAITTARGTTHVYALQQEGGPISASRNSSPVADPFARSLSNILEERRQFEIVHLNALARVRPLMVHERTLEVEGLPHVLPGFACRFHHGALYISFAGSLSYYALNIRYPKVRKDTLQVRLKDPRRWDMRRRITWPEKTIALEKKESPTANSNKVSIHNDSSSCISHIEEYTHRQDLIPIWAHPNVTFGVVDAPMTNVLEKITPRMIAVRRSGPIPCGASQDLTPLDTSLDGIDLDLEYTDGSSPIFDGTLKKEVHTGRIPDGVLSASISTALDTPTSFTAPLSIHSTSTVPGLVQAAFQDTYFAVGSPSRGLVAKPDERDGLLVVQEIENDRQPLEIKPFPEHSMIQMD